MHINRSFQSVTASAQATRMGRSTWEKFARRTWFGCLALLTVMMLALTAEDARAQSANDGFDPGANGDVRALAVQADGKILVGANFTQLGGQTRACCLI